MLSENTFIKYDMVLEEYYITMDCITNYTDYTSDELGAVGITSKTLRNISHSVYRLIYSWYKGHEPYNHNRFMRMKIYDNTQGEVKSLMLAMIEAVKGAIESGMDLNAYVNDPKDNLPYTVKEELLSAMLLDKSHKISYDYDITYTTEELANHAT